MPSNPAIQIVCATEQDVAVVLEMIRELAAYERMSHMVTATEEKIRRTLFGEHPFAEVLLASRESEIAGLAIFYTTYSTFLAEPGLYLEDLYVKPQVRGKGVGTALLAHLARMAVERGWSRVEWSVLHWNESAIEFYRKIGAALLDDWKICRLAGESLARMASQ